MMSGELMLNASNEGMSESTAMQVARDLNYAGNRIAITLDQIDSGEPYWLSTLPTANHAEKIKAMRYLQDKDSSIDDIVEPKQFNVANFILTKNSWTDAEGQKVECPKLVLIDKDGHSCTVTAKIWVKEFFTMLQGFGFPPWEEPIPVSAKQVKGNGPNKYYTLVIP